MRSALHRSFGSDSAPHRWTKYFSNSRAKPEEPATDIVKMRRYQENATNNRHINMPASNSQLLTFIRKEFAHVLRDRKTLLILFGLPIVQIIIFGFALTNEVRNASILAVD